MSAGGVVTDESESKCRQFQFAEILNKKKSAFVVQIVDLFHKTGVWLSLNFAYFV